MAIVIRALTGRQIVAALEDLGRLRMAVFAEWPYLYDGDPHYEEEYLQDFAAAPDAVLAVACDGERVVGAATASPLQAQKEEFHLPFAARGMDVSRVFYFGESVLLPQYRGQGIGNAFFDHREAHAIVCGAATAVFAAVVRPADHPHRPAGYRPLDTFWRKRGFAPLEGLVTTFEWKDHGDADETAKPMQFWLKDL